MNVSAVIVTRGNVDLAPIWESLPAEWEKIEWNNGRGRVRRWPGIVDEMRGFWEEDVVDLSVYGRYAAIAYASHEVIYVQDDDCIVSDPQAIVDAWEDARAKCEGTEWDPRYLWHASPEDIRGIGLGQHVCCNMPQEFRHDFYADHGLVGFGAAFHRDAPQRAFLRALQGGVGVKGERDGFHTLDWPDVDHFRRTCDIVFTALTPRVLVDIPHTSFDYASDPDRMWRQPSHQSERQRMLDLVRQVR